MLGIWLWPEQITRYGAEHVTARLSEIGVTDIFFLTKGLSGSLVFPYRETPPAAPGRDLMAELTKAAHTREIRVHGWFTSAADAWYKDAHPEKGLCHITRGQDRGIVSIADTEYAVYMRDIVGFMAKNYDVDGLSLDYIRYNHMAYGWDKGDLAAYRKAGADTDNLKAQILAALDGGDEGLCRLFRAYREEDENLRAFARVRRERVTRFADALISAAKAEKPGITVSAALMPEGSYPDIAFSTLHYGQNYSDFSARLDLALPMAYSRAYGKDSGWVKDVAERTAEFGMKTLAGIHAYEGGTGESVRSDVLAVQSSDHPNIRGVCLFRSGACGFAALRDGILYFHNGTNEPVTRLETDGRVLYEGEIAAEHGIAVPCESVNATVRASSGTKEISVYTV